MIPAQRFYFLLVLGGAIALLLAIAFSPQFSLVGTLVFDLVVLVLAIWDGLRGKSNRVQVTPLPLQRLSVGRDNPVVISVAAGKQDAKVLIRDGYPANFQVSTPNLQATLAPNSTEELTYTIHPDSRGEFEWRHSSTTVGAVGLGMAGLESTHQPESRRLS